MKNSIQLLPLIFLVAISSVSSAQVTVAVKGGLNLSTMVFSDESLSVQPKMNHPGFHVGGTVDIGLAGILSLETGTLFTSKGSRMSESYSNGIEYEMKQVMNTYYLEVPVKARVSAEIGNVGAYVAAGPYVGVGLFGKSKLETTLNGHSEEEKEDISWGSDEEKDDMKRMDTGLTFGGGVELGPVEIGVAYNLGLLNLSPFEEEDFKFTNRNLGISVAYKIKNKH
jgi:hypothetical protein